VYVLIAICVLIAVRVSGVAVCVLIAMYVCGHGYFCLDSSLCVR
jgi:hypothetical protein